MKKSKKDKNSKCYKIKKSIRKKLGKLALILALIAAITAAVLKLIEFIKRKRSEKTNPTRDFKVFVNMLGAQSFKVDDQNISGVVLKSLIGATSLDLSNASFKQDAFISLNSAFSAITITVPEGINVKVDGLFTKTTIENFAQSDDNSLPTLYVAAKCKFTAVRISRQE